MCCHRDCLQVIGAEQAPHACRWFLQARCSSKFAFMDTKPIKWCATFWCSALLGVDTYNTAVHIMPRMAGVVRGNKWLCCLWLLSTLTATAAADDSSASV